MEVEVLKWVQDAFGPGAVLALVLYWYGVKNRSTKPDIAKELISKIDGMNDNVVDLRERVARIEGKLSND